MLRVRFKQINSDKIGSDVEEPIKIQYECVIIKPRNARLKQTEGSTPKFSIRNEGFSSIWEGVRKSYFYILDERIARLNALQMATLTARLEEELNVNGKPHLNTKAILDEVLSKLLLEDEKSLHEYVHTPIITKRKL